MDRRARGGFVLNTGQAPRPRRRVQPPVIPGLFVAARYVRFTERRDRRVQCACGHVWTPEVRPGPGHSLFVVKCRGDAGRPCGRRLLQLIARGSRWRLVAETVDGEVARWVDHHHFDYAAIVIELLTTPPRAAAE